MNICFIRTVAYTVDYTERTGQITAIPLYIPLQWRQMAFRIKAFKNHPAKLMSFSLYFSNLILKSTLKSYNELRSHPVELFQLRHMYTGVYSVRIIREKYQSTNHFLRC